MEDIIKIMLFFCVAILILVIVLGIVAWLCTIGELFGAAVVAILWVVLIIGLLIIS